MRLDPRTTPARPDLAARELEGRVEAARFVDGRLMRIAAPVAPLRRAPRADAPLDTELLFGERVTVYEVAAGWAWAQAEADSYVGYCPAACLGEPRRDGPTHVVAAPRTFAFPTPSIKTPPVHGLPMLSALRIVGTEPSGGRTFAVSADGHFFVPGHLRAIGAAEPDPVAVAERFLHAPYLWGGRTWLGIDCSGLVQVALRACGRNAPRDSDMLEAMAAEAVDPDPRAWRRGDLLFWPGHVAFVRDEATILHANAHHMAVAVEATGPALSRIAAAQPALRAVRRALA